jgi:hypothetical protein
MQTRTNSKPATFTVEAFHAVTGEWMEVTKPLLSQAEWLYDYMNERGWVAYNIHVGTREVTPCL